MVFRNKTVVVLSVCLLTATLSPGAVPGQLGWRLDGSAFLQFGRGLETPHTDWLLPNALGKLKVLFIANKSGAYDVPELSYRMDLDVYGLPAETWFRLGDWYWLATWLETSTGAERSAYLESLLDGPCDVIVLGNYRLASLSEANQYKILKRVSQGCGLVMFYRHDADPRLLQQSVPQATRSIARGMPFAGLQFYRDWFMPSHDLLRVNEIAPVLLQACTFGSGRVLIIDYGQQSSVFDALPGAIVPSMDYSYTATLQYDYHQALAARSIQWASGRDPRLVWAEDLPDGMEVEAQRACTPVSLYADWSGADDTMLTQITRVRNRWGEVLSQAEHTLQAHPGRLVFECHWPPLGNGPHFVDCMVRSARGVESFASFTVCALSSLRINAIKPTTVFFEQHQPVSGELALSRATTAGENVGVEYSLEDCYGRVFAKKVKQLDKGAGPAVTFELPAANVVSWAARLRIRLLVNEKVVDQAEVEIRLRRPSRGEYPIAMWGAIPGYGNHAGNLQMRKLGFTAVIGDPMAEARDDLGSMTFGSGTGALIHSLGDEIPVPQPAKGAALNAFLQRRYATLDQLNAAWGTRFSSWEEVEPAYKAVDGDAGSFVRMHECIACGEHLFAENIRTQREAIEKVNPPGVVGPEGSPIGNPELTLAQATFWGPYLTVRDNLLVNALGRPGLLRGNWFGGYVEDRRVPTRNRHVLWQSILGGNNVIEYFTIGGGLLAPDLTLMPFVQEFLPSWQEIRGGLGQQLARAQAAGNPVAVLHSQASEHIGRAGGSATDTVKAHECLLNLLGDAGYAPRFVSSGQVRSGALERDDIRALFLVRAFAMSNHEIAAIRSFAERGGTVIADIPPAWFDEGCHLRARRGMDDLFEIESSTLRASLAEQAAQVSRFTSVSTPYGPLLLRGVDSSIRPRHSQKIGDVYVHAAGRGKFVLLGGTLWTEGREDFPTIATMGRILRELAGVAPAFELQYATPPGKVGTKVYSYKRGDIWIDAVLPPEATDPRIVVRPTLNWSQSKSTYDLRTGKYLGDIARLTCDVVRATAVVVARLRYVLGEVKMECAEREIPGETLRFNCTIKDTQGKPRGGHVVRIGVKDSRGNDRPEYAAWLDGDQESQEGRIALALNDVPGTWTIIATDVISGRTTEASFDLQP